MTMVAGNIDGGGWRWLIMTVMTIMLDDNADDDDDDGGG